MKHLVIILSALLLCSNLQAEQKNVELRKKAKGANRSETFCPTVTHDGIFLSFSPEENINELYFEVKTVTGTIITSETISLVAGQTYTTSIGEVESDVYILEVKINGEIYCGYLEIY